MLIAALSLAACDSAAPGGDLGGASGDLPQDAPAGAVLGGRDLYDVDVLARVPSPPGLPEGVAIRDGVVYVGTNPGGLAPGPQSGARSRIFGYRTDTGEQVFEAEVQGQDVLQAENPAYGVQGLAFDGNGFLYALDKAPARVLRFDVTTGEQTTYATFPDVPLCAVTTGDQCSENVVDLAPYPNYPAFAPDGALYLTDLQQALIWRVPPGGGVPEVAFTDFAFGGPNGPNGLQFYGDGTTVLMAQTVNPPGVGTAGAGRLYTLQRQADGSLDDLTLFYESPVGSVLDGFALAQSGNVYLNVFTTNQIAVVGPGGTETARIGQAGTGANGSEIPFDAPASAAFDGDRLFVTNQSVMARNPLTFAVLDVFAGEPGLPLFTPTNTTETEEGPQ